MNRIEFLKVLGSVICFQPIGLVANVYGANKSVSVEGLTRSIFADQLYTNF